MFSRELASPKGARKGVPFRRALNRLFGGDVATCVAPETASRSVPSQSRLFGGDVATCVASERASRSAPS